jgi:hypothetical protein
MATIALPHLMLSWNGNYKYKPYTVKHNSINYFIKVYFLHCFVQRHVSALVWAIFRLITFLSNVKYTISNATVNVTYQISYNVYKMLTLIPLYSSIKIKVVAVNYIEY